VEIWLPRASEAEGVSERVPQACALVGHILLVDEAADVLLVLAAFLRGSGFAVTQAANASEALCHLRRGTNFTMMISDFPLFGADGMDLARKARQLRPGLPVLIMSSFGHAERLSELPPGFAVLRKPFRKEDLLASVGALLPERPAAPWELRDNFCSTDPTDAVRPVSSSGPLDAGAVVEPSSWAASSHSPEQPLKRTSA
jgi:DNA-binding response OmpR family regulator